MYIISSSKSTALLEMPSLSRLRPYRCFFQQHTNYSGVSPSDFARIERERDRRRRKFRFRRYDAKNHMLIMALMTRVHETLHARLFSMLICLQICQMGLQESWGLLEPLLFMPEARYPTAAPTAPAKGTRRVAH